MPPRMRYPARLHSPRPAESNASTNAPPRNPPKPRPALAGRGKAEVERPIRVRGTRKVFLGFRGEREGRNNGPREGEGRPQAGLYVPRGEGKQRCIPLEGEGPPHFLPFPWPPVGKMPFPYLPPIPDAPEDVIGGGWGRGEKEETGGGSWVDG